MEKKNREPRGLVAWFCTGTKRGLVEFVSTCPKCAQSRSQLRYDRESLVRLLERGYPVEAYCEGCDDYWLINVKERAGLAIVMLAR
jgi:hypothetical protein